MVKDRAQARWEALVKGEVDKAYAFISPGGRESYSLDFYRNSIRPGFWKAVEVKGVQCQPDVCEVQLDITYVLRGGTFRTPAVETWVKDNGAWWYVFKPA